MDPILDYFIPNIDFSTSSFEACWAALCRRTDVFRVPFGDHKIMYLLCDGIAVVVSNLVADAAEAAVEVSLVYLFAPSCPWNIASSSVC